MALRSILTRLAIAAAGGALVALAATTPAVANDEWGDDPGASSRNDGWGHHGEHHGDHQNPRLYEGRVTARGGLILRGAPNRGGAYIRTAPYGSIVSIFCKTPGETIGGNPLWYLLTDGTWAWGAARYIDNIGPAPRWC
ncbi:SH3 domain-containing protein [Streptomyces sp. SAS_270]|uniref:SH3 domain-containing protein n=1 Tax=Streptomyces sp. SAS_270 TaxID=3412748 RepID=UPI00403CDFAE